MSLRHVVLIALTRGEMSGYDIAKRFDNRLSYVWHASHQQIYRELKQLTDDGWVSYRVVGQEERPDKKLYRLTADGQAALHAWLEDPRHAVPARIKDPLLVKLFAGDALDPASVRRQIRELAGHYRQQLEALREIERQARRDVPQPTAGEMCAFLALRRGIHNAQCALAWAEEADAALVPYLSEVAAETPRS